MTPEWLAKHALLRQKFEQMFAERQANPRLVPQDPPPRYDEVYEEGMLAWAELVENEP